MNAKELRNKTSAELQEELAALSKEQFNLRMQRIGKDAPRSHQIKNVRRNIARLKTILSEKQQHE